MYTVTVKISANGTVYKKLGEPEHESITGHMWYSISNGSSTESHGFAPIENGSPVGNGEVKPDDDVNGEGIVRDVLFKYEIKVA